MRQAQLDANAFGRAGAVQLGQIQQLFGNTTVNVQEEQIFDHRVRLAQAAREHIHDLDGNARMVQDGVGEIGALQGEGVYRLEGDK